MRNAVRRALPCSVLLALAFAAPAFAQEAKPRAPWDRETLDLLASLPVQEGGRVKPLDTIAGFKLLKLNGRRALTTPSGEALSPIAWLADCLFYPELAQTYQVFLVQNAEVLDDLGIDHEAKHKRDRYTWNDLAPGLMKLDEKFKSYSQIEEKDRSAVQEQVVLLRHNMFEFMQLTQFLNFARVEGNLEGAPELQKVLASPADARPSVASVLGHVPALKQFFQGLGQTTNKTAEFLDGGIGDLIKYGGALALLPPSVPQKEQREWMTPGEVAEQALEKGIVLAPQLELVRKLEVLARETESRGTFKERLSELHAGIEGLADERGEYSKIPIEVTFYRWDFFYKALLVYVLGFILVAVSWMIPDKKILERAITSTLVVATVLVVTGIVFRCIIRSRPPVSTLYETILFITAVSSVVCLILETINRQRIAIAVAQFLGMAGMFLANKYEFKEAATAGDTMPSLVAVLDTNFWLSTHVTSVTMGYSAGLLAAAIAHVWLIGKVLGFRPDDGAFYKNVSRMTYGILCFGLFFSVVGTILGGIWANYSWGRFWGWDPKENGALMICLWELIILHARMGGYIRDYGLAVMAIFGGIVVSFSWWGVNLLGVGLHSYGFTTGIFQILVAFWVLEALVILLSGAWRLAMAQAAPPAAGAAPPAPAIEPGPTA
jgi:ABC-type transport system involved in cytochrome c biogenesis permease subunit